ncbi:SDR family NAD(P)-dependent oxidoreductase [Chelatococcus reniformis]|uniref:Short-chain dehydrogenase n=1 Tax=Chelatococcus reniformis TaxID=1494448 RepID=A0A916UWS9_9HYPH|nr:SDR family oxidoreductase [Chelatococcus reniformis]GGC91761.1 short-chain dehydrogenase [Chelatococcus reniformis]
MIDLSHKTALVTGASRGIGRAAALALARAGARVLVHYAQAAPEADRVVGEIRAGGGEAHAVAMDLAAPDGPHALAARVGAIAGERLDILVANAGVAKAMSLEETTVADFDALFALNVRAPFFLVQQLLPMLADGSSVVLTGSLGARAYFPKLAAYGATKGAIHTLVTYLAAELGARGIRVNAVAPGVIETDMAQTPRSEAGRRFLLGMQALQRIGQPADVGDVIAFLASDASRWITGATLPVDGGSKL